MHLIFYAFLFWNGKIIKQQKNNRKLNGKISTESTAGRTTEEIKTVK